MTIDYAMMNLERIINKTQCITNCKLHCGVRGESFAGFLQHRSVLPDRNALRNPQRQLTGNRWQQV